MVSSDIQVTSFDLKTVSNVYDWIGGRLPAAAGYGLLDRPSWLHPFAGTQLNQLNREMI
jgi:hypothetical protein